MNKVGVSQKVIIVNKEGNFLALRRSKTAPNRPLLWDLPGGDLEFGEDVLASILREIKEEVGLEIKGINPFGVFSKINNKGEFWVSICYTAKATSVDVVLSYEHDRYKWLTTEEFLELESAPKYLQFISKFKKEIKR